MNTSISVLINFIQGEIWKKQRANFKKDGVVLPLFTYCDDVETGNALGSHAGINAVGAGYAMIPCLPPNFQSSLQSITVCDLFHTKDRKEYGYKLFFKRCIEELRKLQETGIEVLSKGKQYKVYFITSLVLGDNLGVNGLLGFTESFASTNCCRMCYAGPEQIHTLKQEDESLLRTEEKYNEDIEYMKTCGNDNEISTISIRSSKSGIKEECFFNELPHFHVIENPTVDFMHDLLEGVCNYDMAEILLYLIEKKFFSIDYLNYILKTTDFGFESSNLPPQINLEYVKRNKRLKMSASEMLFFTRYFGIIIGDEVPRDDEVWNLYIKLREIINILTSPIMRRSYISQLETIIFEHNQLYMNFFGNLKYKYHCLTHYPRIIPKIGPVIKCCSLRPESKHQEIKNIISTSSSHVNILKTIGIRYNLSRMNLKFSKYYNISYGSQVQCDSVDHIFPQSANKKALSKIIINEITYSINTIIIPNIYDDGPEYGKIEQISTLDDKVFFHYKPFAIIGFDCHYFAHSVVEVHESKLIDFNSLAVTTPCLMFVRKNTSYIVTRHIL